MENKEFLASRIAAAKDAPQKTTWWFRHCHAAARYLIFSGMPKSNGIVEIHQEVLDIANEWDRLMKSGLSAGSMRRHATLEIGLVDAARNRDTKAIENIGSLLVEDLNEKTKEFSTRNADLPAERLRRLFEEHVALFVERVDLDVEGADRRACTRKAEANAMALTDFTVEWF
jgi:hypothetical protein